MEVLLDIEVQIDSNDPGVNILDDTFYINSIDAGETFINNSTPFSIQISDDIFLRS